MHIQIDLAPHFDELARAITFEVQSLGQIELEALMLDLTDGSPLGALTFDGARFTIHPLLLMAVLPAFTHSVACLVGIEDLVFENPVAWMDAGYPSVGVAFTALFSDAAQKMMSWGTSVLLHEGYCPLELLMKSMSTGQPFDQAKTRSLFLQTGLRQVFAA